MFETHACMNITKICAVWFGNENDILYTHCIHIVHGQTDLNLRYRWQTSFGHIASVHGHTILIGDDGWLSHHISISITLYIIFYIFYIVCE
jgi:hypothetical protein